MKKLKFRKAKKEDFDSIRKLANQLWDTEKIFSENIQDSYYISEKTNKKLMSDIVSRKNIFLVAELENEIVGFIEGNIIDDLEAYREKIAYINRLVVDKSYRKNGIGKLLIDDFSKRVKQKGCKYLKLNAFEKNIPAIECYKKYGFEEYSIMYMKRIED